MKTDNYFPESLSITLTKLQMRVSYEDCFELKFLLIKCNEILSQGFVIPLCA